MAGLGCGKQMVCVQGVSGPATQMGLTQSVGVYLPGGKEMGT